MAVAPQTKADRRRAERRRRRRSLYTIAAAIAVSLLVHAALLPMPRRWFFAGGPFIPAAPLMVDLSPNKPPPPRHRVRRLLHKPPMPPPTGPVVDAPRTKDTNVPRNARFLSSHNTHVKKETVARNPGTGPLAAVPIPSSGKGKPHPASKAHKGKTKAKTKLAEKTHGKKPGHKSAATTRHALPVDEGSRLIAMASPKPRIGPKDQARHLSPQPAKPALLPDFDQMAHAIGGARADTMPNVQLGTQTWLNSRQFKYASFWNRIRSLAGQAWEPMVEDAMRVNDPNGARLGGEPRMSVVVVTLGADGTVLHVAVSRTSGARFLDEVAVGAFESVGRFPNPPRPLVGPDGRITFQFAFILNFHVPPVAGP